MLNSILSLHSSTLYFSLLLFLASLLFASASTNFGQCLQDVQAGKFGPNAGVDNSGNPVSNLLLATAIPYEMCIIACGSGPEAFSWSDFSNQFSAWLLPWLALLSQLPFGANDRLENFMTVVLTVGSPVLAAYSAALTVLNGRWIVRRFSGSTYPNTYRAIRVLSSLQQAPIDLDLDRETLLPSLIVLPDNDHWWKDLLEHLNYTHTWSISAATSIAWVFIAYVFTVVDSLSDVLHGVEVNGQAVGSIWLWLLPVVVAWLQISPKCDSIWVADALRRANNIAYVATPTGIRKRAALVSNHYAISFGEDDDPLRDDERCTSPIYNYARLFSWTAVVEEIAGRFHEATRRAQLFQPVGSETEWMPNGRNGDMRKENRIGTEYEVIAYCTPFFPRRYQWGSEVWKRIIIASVLALVLQWGTAGAAIFVVWETPTRGLGCRSGSYIIYALLSTIVWALLLLSSILARYSTFDYQSRSPLEEIKSYHVRASLAGTMSVIIRRFGKILAAVNAVWIILTCIFQFSAFFDRCYCDSSVIGLGAAKAFNVIQFNTEDLDPMRGAWIGGVFMAVISALVYMCFIIMCLKPHIPHSIKRE
ncbi:hypothetical protein EV361DRAFT_44201 [Lentinula raphanica]|uniref:Uncharacterized protein n=1 Tax=Lentinula raphanica TaxID=153919 RepID=A0AA38NZ68_9AGAR|nr:hypothetical protein F5878DRAFT_410156 [Lentinula raphanica]KAJ3973669.1 hypothetical protein EV361DRAFT_44201 [Lentinula raphanica]